MRGAWTLGARVLRALFASLWLTGVAQAQTVDPFEAILHRVEQSTLSTVLQSFGETFWAFNYTVPARDDAEISAPEAFRLNAERLESYVQSVCPALNAQQRSAIDQIVFTQSLQMGMLLAVKEPDLRANFPAYRPGPSRGFPFVVVSDCGERTETGADGVKVSRDLVLAAIMGAMLADAQVAIIAPRNREDPQAFVNVALRSWDRTRGAAAFARLRRSAVWRNYLRQQIQLVSERRMSLDEYERWIYDGLERRQPGCRNDLIACKFAFTADFALFSVGKFDAYFTEQLQFILAHELGHFFMHTDMAIGTCEAERQLELDADAFALTLVRPRDGLYRYNGRTGEAAIFDTGVTLFLMRGHQLASMADGHTCYYPTFSERLTAIETFEATRFDRSTRMRMRSSSGQP